MKEKNLNKNYRKLVLIKLRLKNHLLKTKITRKMNKKLALKHINSFSKTAKIKYNF